MYSLAVSLSNMKTHIKHNFYFVFSWWIINEFLNFNSKSAGLFIGLEGDQCAKDKLIEHPVGECLHSSMSCAVMIMVQSLYLMAISFQKLGKTDL